MSSPGQVVMVELTGFGVCQCGAEVHEGSTVGYWYSGIGKSYDKIVSCPTCRRPKSILGERAWLIRQREYVRSLMTPFVPDGSGGWAPPTAPPELGGALTYLDSQLDSNWRRANIVFLKLLEKLPKCDECSKTATYQIRYGPFFCDQHVAEHPTAQKVDWGSELVELGVDE